MNLVKWLRKNRSKAMAIVTIGTLAGFMGLGTLLEHVGRTKRLTVAYFGQGKKISTDDLTRARRELDILRMLRTDDLLRSQDLQGILLGELLFSEARFAPALIAHMKQVITANEYRISDEQLINIYKRSMPSDMYWILLKKEAELAGIKVANEDVGRLLGRIIPQLFNGVTYSQFMASFVNRWGISQEQVLTTVGELLAVLQYAQIICSTEDVTNSQLSHLASWQNETADVQFIRLEAGAFAQAQDPPSEQHLVEHFDKYKNFFAGQVTEENPYGFGYKLPNRVQSEYAAVKLDDVSSIVTPPTPQEAEEYYRKHTKELTKSVPSDPNDPNSPQVERTKSYAEVAEAISEQLKQDKINSKAESILREAKTLTEAGLQDVDDVEKLSPEQFGQKAGKYESTAEQLSKKYNVKIYSGQTGLLSPTDMQMDQYLGRLFVTGYGYRPVPLTQVLFMVDDLDTGAAELLDVQKPRIYENIGPARDLSGEIMAMVRVIKAEKASEPNSIDYTFSKSTFEFEAEKTQSNGAPAKREHKDTSEQNKQGTKTNNVYSVRERVIEDVKELAAMDVAKSKAEELINLAGQTGWDGALNKLNDLYRQQHQQAGQSEQAESEPNIFRLENLTNIRRIPSNTLETLVVQSGGNPEEKLFVREAPPPNQWLTVDEARIESQFIEKLYSLVPEDSNTAPALPVSIEFKPHLCFYVIKDISVNRLSQQDYEKIKAAQAYRQEHIQTQTLAAIHFNPENIVKRLNFRPASEEGSKPATTDVQTEPEEPS